MMYNKKRWERHGFSQKIVGSTKEYIEENFNEPDRDSIGLLSGSVVPDDLNVQWAIADYRAAIAFRHFGCKVDIPDTRQLCKDVIALCSVFLFGEWQFTTIWNDSGKLLTKEKAKKIVDWYDPVRLGILASIIIGDNESLKKFAAYPTKDSRKDSGHREITKEDGTLMMVLANWFLDDKMSSSTSILNGIRLSNRRKPKYLLACLDAADQKDYSAFLQALKNYVKLFFEQDAEKGKASMASQVSLEASILFACARKNQTVTNENISAFIEESVPVTLEDYSTGKLKKTESKRYLIDFIITPETLGMK